MSPAYPFEIPKAIEDLVAHGIVSASHPCSTLENWGGPNGPEMFGLFDCWHGRTLGALAALKIIVDSVEPKPSANDSERDHWLALNGLAHSLEAMLLQFGGLLEWARLTWPYDPAVEDSDDGESSPEEDDTQLIQVAQ